MEYIFSLSSLRPRDTNHKSDHVLVSKRLKERRKEKTFIAENIHGELGGDTDVRNEEPTERFLSETKNALTKTLLSTSGYEKVSCKEECSPTFHFCLLAVSSWLQTSRSDRVWPPSRRRQARGAERARYCQNSTSTASLSLKPSPAFCCHKNSYIIVKNQSNLFVLASQSFPLLSAAFNCMMCFPADRVRPRAKRFIHKPMESLIRNST